MGVDQAGREDGIAFVDTLARLKLTEDLRARSDGRNAFPANSDRAILNQAPLAIHCDNVPGGDDQVGRLGFDD